MKFFALFLLSLVVSSQAFCIYNQTPNTAFFIRQMTMNTGGDYTSRFKNENLRPYEKDCCPYTNSDCNNSGGIGDIVTLAFQGSYQDVNEEHWLTATLPAGGWLELTGGGGTNSPIQIQVYEADGKPYTTEVQRDVRGILLT